jgi:hypothetical protein
VSDVNPTEPQPADASLPRVVQFHCGSPPCSSKTAVRMALLHGAAPTYDGTAKYIFQISQRDKRNNTLRANGLHIHSFTSERALLPLPAYRGIANSSYHNLLTPFFSPQNLNHAAFRTSTCSRQRSQRHTKAKRLGHVQPLSAKEPYVLHTELVG